MVCELDEIVNHDISPEAEITEFVECNGVKRRNRTTKGVTLCLRFKDGSESWETLKNAKKCFPVQVAKYAVAADIVSVPAFAWWVPYTLKKRDRITDLMDPSKPPPGYKKIKCHLIFDIEMHF